MPASPATLTRASLARERAFPGIVVGVDEVGRGALAGPVVAAAVILDINKAPPGLADSKSLSPERRADLADQIMQGAVFALGAASAAEIDRINILRATYLAMQRAVAPLVGRFDHILVDGNRTPPWPFSSEAIIGGDACCASIAAASILAKVCRDRLMVRLDPRYPAYGWARNKGYGVQAHRDALATQGPCIHHRLSFAPVARAQAACKICPERS